MRSSRPRLLARFERVPSALATLSVDASWQILRNPALIERPVCGAAVRAVKCDALTSHERGHARLARTALLSCVRLMLWAERVLAAD